MKVAVPSIMSQAGKDYLTSRGFELIETKSQSAAALVKEAADADGIILMTEPFPNTLADQLPKLKVIARHGVGQLHGLPAVRIVHQPAVVDAALLHQPKVPVQLLVREGEALLAPHLVARHAL